MFGIDFSEILVIFGIALVVLGPARLPKLAATIGRWIGRARAMARQFREQLEQEAGGLQRDMDLGPEFGGQRPAGNTRAPSTPSIRPPAQPTVPASPAGTAESSGSAAPPASAEISVTDLTQPMPISAADPVAAVEDYEFELAHTHAAALHPSPAAAADGALSGAAAANGSAPAGAAARAAEAAGVGEPHQQVFWPPPDGSP